jgi:hypothetical protein
MVRKTRRFGARIVEKGKYKGCLHVSTETARKFRSELWFLCEYLNDKILPREPEELSMSQIILAMQNILEYEMEMLIKNYVSKNPSKKDVNFTNKVSEGYISFKAKFEWLKEKKLISGEQRNVMEEIRLLRNANVHMRPTNKRLRYKYSTKPLLTKESLRKIFLDVEKVLQKLRVQSGSKPKWDILPPGYATEMKWPEEAIALFDKKT